MTRRRKNSLAIAVLLLALCVVAAGCKKEEKPAPPPPKPAAAPKKAIQGQPTSTKAAVPNAVQKAISSSAGKAPVQGQSSSIRRIPVSSAQIDFTGKKDPFKPYIVEPPAPAKSKASRGPRASALPIQSFDVNKFKLVGIIAGLKENRALIVDPYRKGYVVKTGMLLGNNNGRITRITGDAVEVLEQFRDDSGIIRKRTVRLVLPQKK